LHFLEKFSKSTEILRTRLQNIQDAAYSCSPAELGKCSEERVCEPKVATTPYHIFKLHKTAEYYINYSRLHWIRTRRPRLTANWRSSDRCAPCRHAERSVKWQTICHI